MRLLFSVAIVLSLSLTSALEARSLYWRSFRSDAQLDRNGVLTVAETQRFVFDGDWNGGERSFNIRNGQSLEILAVERIDGTDIIPLVRGDLSRVDHYQLMAGNVLRWRSRLPSDPEFVQTELTYRIRYALHGTLRGRDGKYRLAHDFAFPSREGLIQRFTLQLVTDDSWGGIEPLLRLQASDLLPGHGYVVERDLVWRGAGTPSAVTELPNPLFGKVIGLLLLAGVAAIVVRFYRLERARGRFGELTPIEEIDEAWLEKHVFSLSPEAAGAAYDGKVGAPEVAAAIAAMAQQKQIETSVEKRMFRRSLLTMRLLVERNEIEGHRRAIVNKLFFGGRKQTDTDAVRKHYATQGLDLAAIVRPPVESELERLPHWKTKVRVFNWKVSVLALVSSLLLMMVAAGLSGGNDWGLVSTAAFFGVLALIGATVSALVNAQALSNQPRRFLLVFVFLIPMLALLLFYCFNASDFQFGTFALLTSIAWALAIVHLVTALLRSTESDAKIAFRRKLLSARRYFVEELGSAEPKLRDDWFPYILAFGLGSNVDSWFSAHGGSSSAMTSHAGSSFGSHASSSSGGGVSSWSGGGGAFGGAGATGTWAIAAAALGAGVSTPSSGGGSSGGGGGGGGSSSGGGGGGGW
ncbi:MAG TPA: DUF2207 domain-containing protein [Thermoanaerobaculia bacterium]